MNRSSGGPVHVWYTDVPPRVAHEGREYTGGMGVYLLRCDQCGLETKSRRYGTPRRELKDAFNRAHRIEARRGYTGRHRAPVPRERVRVM